MYLDDRLKSIPPGRFIEVGPGSGEITNRRLRKGWSGTVYDLSYETITGLKQRFAPEIASDRLAIVLGDYLRAQFLQPQDRVDVIISCMVMEHMNDEDERKFMRFSSSQLRAGGRMIGLVPASPLHWGIEDDIAGHYRRYSRNSLEALLGATGWKLCHFAGLTFPISNLLLPLSNILVRRNEASKLALSTFERTKHSGHRSVRFKTYFPSIMKLLLNEQVLLPLHWLQKAFSNSEQALVIYFEATNDIRANLNGKQDH
jgi:SAM-dependent methyltransferase